MIKNTIFILLIVALLMGFCTKLIVSYDSQKISIILTSGFQIIGVFIVLYSIFKQFLSINELKLNRLILDFIKADYNAKKGRIINVLAVDGIKMKGSLSAVKLISNNNDIESKVKYIFEAIKSIEINMEKLNQDLKAEIENQSIDMAKRVENLESKIERLQDEFKSSIIHNLKYQFVGMVMIIYGLIIPIIKL